jgi:hypothetical protein
LIVPRLVEVGLRAGWAELFAADRSLRRAMRASLL